MMRIKNAHKSQAWLTVAISAVMDFLGISLLQICECHVTYPHVPHVPLLRGDTSHQISHLLQA